MTTTFTVRVEEQLKKNYLDTMKTKGLDGATMIRVFMEKISTHPDLIQFDLDESLFDNLLTQKSTTEKLERISNKLDALGL